jgi:DNA-binding NarL/FixJ family response regulator
MEIKDNIRVAVADDHPMVISGLINMMRQVKEITIKWKYEDGDSLLSGLEVNLPDVLLLDIQMPGAKSGVTLAADILRKYPQLRILALTNLDSVLYVYNLLQLGVKGYLLKTTKQQVLIGAIKQVHDGMEFLEDNMRIRLEEIHSKMNQEASLKASLTKRETEILRMIVNGHTTKEISEHLHLGFRTVESYRYNILLKLNANNTATLVRKALESGII